MLIKNCNAFDFTRKKIFKTLTRNNLGGGGPFKVEALCICTLCSKTTTDYLYLQVVKLVVTGGSLT